ncbi:MULTISPECIES: NADPH-dependent FMN reductase [unclassified Chitinophaga]|uniref:NADPH-dependent FMN reductase n=1 Tax=unclassified Chitinophaga TaxID=2619133 RepID=UPI0009D15F77|nr:MULTISPECIES: NAD(P)H-dependent oxidoreductase [unclassified Chitinophaga]OMP75075.1 flavoprotein [[Flexibacter] sp. ATCC 35208]WPV65005.1 NAD(P)H-dependent oxidoreductase [Chitinophaga sp. LS1]
MFKILCISGSLRPTSSNTNILKAIPQLAEWPGISFSIYEGLDQLPYFSPELDYEGSTPAATVADLRAQLSIANAVIVCTPEYAFGIPGVLKNALDWIVSSGEFVDKPTAVISASPMMTGGDKANASLVQTLKVMTATITDDRILTIPTVRTKIDAAGNITDNTLKADLVKIVTSLIS